MGMRFFLALNLLPPNAQYTSSYHQELRHVKDVPRIENT